MRPWDKHPPWAHWVFYAIWNIAGTFGPMGVSIWLVGKALGDHETTRLLWIGIVLCVIWVASLAVDWLLVRWLQTHVEGWAPWRPRERRGLRS